MSANTPNLFARSRRRIVAVIMTVLVAVFAVMLVAIYAFSHVEVYDRNVRALESYAMTYQADRLPPELRGQQGQQGQFRHGGGPGDRFQGAAPFYAVLFDAAGEVNTVETDGSDAYTADELVALAQEALATGERSGLDGALLFAVVRAPGYTLVAFMDNTLVAESAGTLFRYTLIVGLVALVVLFFVAWWLAGRIVAPLQKAYEMQRRFISDAGHELKTPVAVVEANAELLQREVGENAWLQNIRYENGRMGVLVAQLLQLARAEGPTHSRHLLDLSRTVEKEALSIEPLAYERSMAFTCDVQEGIEVEGDASELARLVAILLDNAFSHGAPRSEVALRLTRHDRSARLAVTNDIAPGDVETLRNTALFDRFSRGDVSRHAPDNAAGGHYGLGLAIARAIVEAHGGTIEAAVDESAPSITFTASLPLKK